MLKTRKSNTAKWIDNLLRKLTSQVQTCDMNNAKCFFNRRVVFVLTLDGL